jgi:hypothetical protein
VGNNRKQLVEENAALKLKIQELELSSSERKQSEEAFQNNPGSACYCFS